MSMFNQVQGVQGDIEPEIVRQEMFHKTKFSKTKSVGPGSTNMSMFTEVQGDMMMATEPGTVGQDMFLKNKLSKFSNARTVGKEIGTSSSPSLASSASSSSSTTISGSKQAIRKKNTPTKFNVKNFILRKKNSNLSGVWRGTCPETPRGGSRTSSSSWTAESS